MDGEPMAEVRLAVVLMWFEDGELSTWSISPMTVPLFEDGSIDREKWLASSSLPVFEALGERRRRPEVVDTASARPGIPPREQLSLVLEAAADVRRRRRAG